MSVQGVSGGLLTSVGRVGFWLLPALIGLTGCAQSPARSLARAWNDAPKIRWSKVPKEDAPDEKESESKVAANEPAGKSYLDEPSVFDRFRTPSRNSHSKSPDTADKQTVAKTRSHSGPYDPFLDAEQSAARAAGKKKLSPSAQDDSAEPQIVSARDRLRATLSDDTQRKVIQTADVGEQEQLRLRIESLMSRAKACCEENAWVAARRAAELAQSLAESSGLEFDPDDERPIELLTFINSRLDAEAEEANHALADHEKSSDSEVESSDADSMSTGVSDRATRPGKRRIPFDANVPFDPYARSVALAHLHDNDVEQVFGPSLVRLESPSFEEDAEVSPIAFSRPTDRLRIRRRFTSTPETDPVPVDAKAKDEAPGPPLEKAASAQEIERPELSEVDGEVAPSPPWSESNGPDLVPMIHLADDGDAEKTTPDESGSTNTTDEKLRPASAWPRWMPLSLASLLTAGFCLWLWRRRMQAVG